MNARKVLNGVLIGVMVLAAMLLLNGGAQAQTNWVGTALAPQDTGPTVVATVPVGTNPHGVGVNPTTNRVYVANINSNNVSVIDGASHTVVATVTVGTRPFAIGVNPTTNRVYVANRDSNNVSVMDGATHTVVATVPVGTWPVLVGVNPTTNRVYVANYISNTVSVIDGASHTVVATVPVGSGPYGVGVNPTTNRVYVANYLSNTVSVIDGASDTVVATVSVGSYPTGVGVNPTTNRIYVSNYSSNTVSVIDGVSHTVVATVMVGSGPYSVDVNPTTNRIYVANYSSNTVSVIDGVNNTVVATVTVGSRPFGVGVNPATNRVYVSNYGSDTVSVIQDMAVGPQLTLTKTGNGSGTVGSNPAGINCGTDCTEDYALNTTVTLTATAVPGSTFTGWSGDLSGSVNLTTITMTGNKSITATFSLNTYTLTVATVGDGGVTPAVGAHPYLYGTVVPLTATTNTGSTFTGWSGDLSGSVNPTTITMTGNKSITATFSLNTYTLTVAIVGSGVVTPAVGAHPYLYGTVVPITATAAPGSTFTGWSGTCSGTGSCVVAMTTDQSITATFSVTSPSSRLYLSPAETGVAVTQIFTVEIKADTGGASADTLDAYLDFDPTVLQVVDAAGVPVSAIEPNLTALPNVTWNVVSNPIGQIDFSASKMTPPPLSGTFTAATIRFKALAAVSSTGIALVRSSGRWSDLQLEGEGLTSDLSGAIAHVTFPMLPGRVALEKRGLAGNPRWITPLYRVSSTGVVTGWVRLYQPGTSNLAGVYSATTNANGQFTVTLESAPSGVYDVVVKGANTLSNKKLNVSLPTAGEVDLGTLLVGDCNGDDRVNGGDVSCMISSFTKCAGDPAYRPYADTNNDGCVNGQDVSALIPNFTKAGPIIVTDTLAGSARMATAPIVASSDAVCLSISPLSLAAHVGDILTLDIVVATGINRVDTVDAYLDFDPA